MAVGNSFAAIASQLGADLTIAHPPEFALEKKFLDSLPRAPRIVHSKEEGLDGAQAVYAKSWGGSSYYGKWEEEKKVREGLKSWICDSVPKARSSCTASRPPQCRGGRRRPRRFRDLRRGRKPAARPEGDSFGAGMNPEHLNLLRTALPFINRFKNKTFVVKIGGEIADSDLTLHSFCEEVALLSQVGIHVVMVHGGGKQASQLSKQLGIEPQMVQGRRITTKRPSTSS